MAKLYTSRTYQRVDGIWEDPNPRNNRMFIDSYAFDTTTYAVQTANQWYINTKNNKASEYAPDYILRNYSPIYLCTGLWGNTFATGANSSAPMPGWHEGWMASLNYADYKPARQWYTQYYNRVTLCMPGNGTTADQYGRWWIGPDMTEAAISHSGDQVESITGCWQQEELINLNASSWSYATASGVTTITVNATNHGLTTGTYVTVTGATSTTNPPNGIYMVTGITNNNTFAYTTLVTPTGTAGGILNFTATEYRMWGVEVERGSGTRPNFGTRAVLCYGYHYNSGRAASSLVYRDKPVVQSLNWGKYNFFMGQSSGQVFYLGVECEVTNAFYAYDVRSYTATRRQATEVILASNIKPSTGIANLLPQYPSNIRQQNVSRYLIYSSHYNSAGGFAPMRIVWDISSIASLECTVNYPVGTTAATFYSAPTASTHNDLGYNTYWVKAHQFLRDNVVYITMCTMDKWVDRNTEGGQTRFAARRQRMWVTFTTTNDTNDNILTFHSCLSFVGLGEFPKSFVPYSDAGDKLIVFTHTAIIWIDFIQTTLTGTSWSFAKSLDFGGQTFAQIEFASAHGLLPGYPVTISGLTAGSNPSNGSYRIHDCPTTSSFRIICDTDRIPDGATGGTPFITIGWRPYQINPIQARGYGLDKNKRLLVGQKIAGINEMEIHVLKEGMAEHVSIELTNPIQGYNTYLYEGLPYQTSLKVNAYNMWYERISSDIELTINGPFVSFLGGAKTQIVKTSTTTDTLAAINITGLGSVSITAQSWI